MLATNLDSLQCQQQNIPIIRMVFQVVPLMALQGYVLLWKPALNQILIRFHYASNPSNFTYSIVSDTLLSSLTDISVHPKNECSLQTLSMVSLATGLDVKSLYI